MDPALHHYDFLSTEGSDDEVALVAYRSRYREARDGLVRDDKRILDRRCEPAEAASEDDAYQRLPPAELLLDVIRCSIDSFNSWIHIPFSALCSFRLF